MKTARFTLQAAALTVLAVVWLPESAYAGAIKLTQLATGVNRPIGIDYYEPNNTLIGSINYSGGMPFNFVEIAANGTVVQFSAIAGLTDEVKIATVRSGNAGGFTTGDFFTGNGIDGQIAKITNGGATIINPFVDLPGAGNGLMRGSLYIDRTGVFGDDLIAVTTAGEVWRVDSDGIPTFLADVGGQLEGVMTVPNDVAKYGPLAGKIIAGQETSGSLFAIAADGSVTQYSGIGVNIEDIDLIVPNENFFGMNFGTNSVFGAAASEFAPYVGDILLTQESHAGGTTGLFRLFWDEEEEALVTEAFTLAAGSDTPTQWEHVTFAPAGITDIPPVGVSEPGILFLFGTGILALLGAGRRRRTPAG